MARALRNGECNLTPHIASATFAARRKMGEVAGGEFTGRTSRKNTSESSKVTKWLIW